MRRSLAALAISLSGLLAAPIVLGASFEAHADADLSIAKTDNPDPVNAGDDVTYSLAVTNGGPSDSAGVEVSDDLPPGLTFNPTGTNADCTEAGGTVTCDFGTITNGATVSKDVVVTTDSAAAPSVDNTAEVTATTPDPDTANNSDTATTSVNAADLSIVKSDSPDPIDVGDQITYTLEVTNTGPSDAANVHATDTLPAGLSFAGSPDSCTAAGVVVDCDFTAVAAGATESQSFVVNTIAAAAPSVDNTATLTSDTTDTNPANDSDTETTTVNAVADLAIAKTDSPDPVDAGDDVTYSLAVTNAGPSDSEGVTVTDALPTGVSFNPTGTDPDCSEAGGTVSCAFGTIANGATLSKDVVVTTGAAAAPSVDNTAQVTASTSDPDTSDNSDTETTTVKAADLSIAKTDSPDPVNAGGAITYTLAVTNGGPSAAHNVEASDALPPGLTFKPSGSSPSCDAAGGVVTCDYGTLASGAPPTQRTVVVTTSGGNVGGITNVASVDGDEIDPNPANNSDSETTAVIAAADLVLSKSDTPDPANPGDEIAYTLSVHNNGPNAASNVDVVDVLPAGLSFHPTGSSIACFESPIGTVTCHYGAVANGATESQVIRVGTSAPGVFSNTAIVAGDQFDPVFGNNIDTETTDVSGPPAPARTLGTATLSPRAPAKCAKKAKKKKRKKRKCFRKRGTGKRRSKPKR